MNQLIVKLAILKRFQRPFFPPSSKVFFDKKHPRNYFYLFERKSFYTAKALNMAIPGATKLSRWRLKVVDVWEGLLEVIQLLKKKKTIPNNNNFPNSSFWNCIFLFWRKNILGGYLAWKAFRFFSAFAPPNFFGQKVFFWKFGTGSPYWEDGRKISGDCTVDTVDGSEIGLAAITTFWSYKPL